MKTVRMTLLGAAAGLALALPASAAGAPSVADVRERVERADVAAAYSAWAARMGNRKHAAAAFRRFERVAHRAEAMTRRIEGRRARARAMRALGAGVDNAFDRYAQVLDELPAHVQALVAEAIGRSAELREHVIGVLTRLAERLPEPARTAVLEAISRFLSDGDVEALAAALTSEEVIAPVKEIVLQHLEMVTAHLGAVLDQLEALSSMLPGPALEAVALAIETISGQLAALSEMVGGILDSLPVGGFAGLDVAGLMAGLCNFVDALPIPIPVAICR